MERANAVTLKGKKCTLVGPKLEVGQKAPDFTLLAKDSSEVRLADFAGKVKLLSVTPSLDTPVCDLQARRFNEEASNLDEGVVVINASVDLPFAISRFCATAGIEDVQVLSDHREVSFGAAYGLLIQELRLLARAVLVIDRDDIIRYIEVLPEVSSHPNYDAAIKAVKNIIK